MYERVSLAIPIKSYTHNTDRGKSWASTLDIFGSSSCKHKEFLAIFMEICGQFCVCRSTCIDCTQPPSTSYSIGLLHT